MSKDELVALLPPDLVVVDCSSCGRVTCRDSDLAEAHRDAGLRRFGGYVRGRPACVGCFLGLPLGVDGLRGRSIGQKAGISKIQRPWNDQAIGAD